MKTIRIEPTFASWRDAARALLQARIPPEEIVWQTGGVEADLFAREHSPQIDNEGMVARGALASADADPDAHDATSAEHSSSAPPRMRISRELLTLCETAACFRAPNRWSLLYRLLWRYTHGERDALSAADADGAKLHAMVKAVRRDAHHMEAFLRFRERRPEQGAPRFYAWFEPEHDVLAWVAERFADRMGQVTWMIATPGGTARFDTRLSIDHAAIARDPGEIDDRIESLWLVYYENIFNPARANADVLRGHMAVRYWKNLPEGALIPRLLSDADNGRRRSGQAAAVGAKPGKTIMISPQDAQPPRDEPTSLDQCRRCDLWRHATQAVPGDGPRDARIMLVGEQPGDQEDLAGRAFIGPAGQLLDTALSRASLDRASVFITNAVKHFKWEPRGKRRLHKTPGAREIAACAYWLDAELDAVRPSVVVALGATALKAVLGVRAASLSDHLNRPIEHDGRWVVATYHPSYALRVPDEAARQHAVAQIVDSLRQAAELAQRPAPAADR